MKPEKWVDLHGDALFRFAFLRLRDREAASEAVQETFLAALKNLKQFQGRSSERTWLIGILKFKIFDHFRKRNANRENSENPLDIDLYHRPIGPWRDHPQSWGAIPSDTLENKEFWGAFNRCVEGLPETLRQVFILRELEPMELKKVCNVLGSTPTNVVVRLHRARLRLRKCLETRWFAPPGKGGAAKKAK